MKKNLFYNPIFERALRRIEGHRFYDILSKIPLLTDKNSKFIDLATGWLCSAQLRTNCIRGFFPRCTTIIKNDEPYPEITGYAATSFSRLYVRTSNKYFLYKTIAASDALIQFMQSSGAIPGIIHKDGSFDNLVYSFDQGIMARGLLDTYKASNTVGNIDSEKYKNHGIKAVDFLLKIQSEDGSFPAECKLDGNGASEFNYCVMGKIIIPFIQAFEITKDNKYLTAAQAVGNFVIDTFQDTRGAFCLKNYIKYQNRVHYHCYAIEGLIELFAKVKNRKYYDSIKMGADYLLDIQKENGGFFYELLGNEQVTWEDPPSVAQAVSIWLFLNKKTKDNNYLKASKKAIEYLKKIQYRVKVGKLYGGLPPIIPYRKVASCTWAVEFSIDAFYQYQKITGVSV